MNDPTPPSGVGRYATGSIHFVDADRITWTVTERDSRRDPGAPADRCLVFASENAIRRVWVYPSRWRELSAAELEALSWMPTGRKEKPVKPS